MPYILVRHKVENYDSWKEGFDAHAEARKAAGSTGTNYLMRNADDPNEVVAILEWNDLDQARAFTQDPALKEAMQKAGVTGPPEITFLDAAE